MTRSFLLIAVLLCFSLAAAKVYVFVRAFYPVAQPEECVKISYGDSSVKFYVLNNNEYRHTSYLYSLDSKTMGEFSWKELWDANAEKVSCE